MLTAKIKTCEIQYYNVLEPEEDYLQLAVAVLPKVLIPARTGPGRES
jgi:hypothetical protein